MTYLLTTNQLTIGHGNSPLKTKRINGSFRRGFIIYITLTKAGLISRQFYYDFDRRIRNQSKFEEKLLQLGPSNFNYDDLSLPVNERGQYPKVFAKNMDVISFGWVPCKVTYILDRTPLKFLDVPHRQHTNGPRQPIIVRRDKFVDDDVQHFDANHSFYNLRTETNGSVSYLRFDNFMLNADGSGLPSRPSSMPDCEKHKQQYCVDIYVEMDQQRFGLSADPGLVIANSDFEVPIADKNPPLVTVFDPLQDNGGIGGPPN